MLIKYLLRGVACGWTVVNLDDSITFEPQWSLIEVFAQNDTTHLPESRCRLVSDIVSKRRNILKIDIKM